MDRIVCIFKCIWIKARSCRWRSWLSHRAVDAESPDNAAAADTLPFLLPPPVLWFACLASGCKSAPLLWGPVLQIVYSPHIWLVPMDFQELFYIYKQHSSLLHFFFKSPILQQCFHLTTLHLSDSPSPRPFAKFFVFFCLLAPNCAFLTIS